MSEVNVFLADGFEEVEGLTVVDLLRRAGISVETVSIMGREEITSSHQVKLKADVLFEDADFEETKMIVLPGGLPGTNYLKEHEGLKELILKFEKEGKYLAAICAAPTVYGGLGLLDGRRATCFPAMEDGLGGAVLVREPAVTDGNITTGRGMGAGIDFALRLIEILRDKAAADEVAEKIVYKRR